MLTDGLVRLGLHVADDVPAMVAGDSDPELARRFEFPEGFVPSAEHSTAVIERWHRRFTEGTAFTLAVRLEPTDALIGGCELRPAGRQCAEVSFWVHAPHRGRSYAARALRLLCDWAFDERGVDRILAHVESDNVASQATCRNAGLRRVPEHVGRRGDAADCFITFERLRA